MIYAADYALVDGDAPPDFVKARAAGIGIVGIRGAWGYHGASSVDPTLERDAAHARAAGMRLFGYLFLDYTTDPVVQADAIGKSYKRLPGDLPVMLDLEMETPPAGSTPASRLAIAEQALARLQTYYGPRGVMVYTSQEQWLDHFGDIDSTALGMTPLWLKTPYAWNPHNPPHLNDIGPLGTIPRPWRAPGSPGAFGQQFQGDAIGVPGFSSTVDLSKFLTLTLSVADSRERWIADRIGAFLTDLPGGALQRWQAAHGLTPDGIVGPATFAALTS